MLAKSLIDEALKLDNADKHLPAVTKYLEALIYLNKSLLDLCHQRDVRLGKKDFGNHVRLASNCLTRVCEIHELFRQSVLPQEATVRAPVENGSAAAATSSFVNNSSFPDAADYSTVGPNDPIARAIDYNRRLLSQFDETVHRRKRESGQQQEPTANIDHKLRLERKQLENLYLAKEEKRKTTGETPAQQTWSPRSKAELSSRIRDRSQSEQRISAPTSVGDNAAASPWLTKYLKLLAMDEDVDMRSSQHCRLPRLEEYFGSHIAGTLSSEERKRQAATIEFMFTEQTHLRNLKIVQKLFKLPLVEHQVLPGNFVFPYLQMTLTDLLFGNLEKVIEIHSELNKACKALMKERNPITNFGEVMSQFFEGPFADRFMNTVAIFCRHQQYAIDQLEVRRKHDDRFAAFLKEVESLPICRGLKLGAMLPMETQRVTKYHLMFERILDYEPRDTTNFQHLKRCYAKAKETAEFVNAEKRSFESFHKLAELQHRLGSPISSSDVGFNFQGRVYVYDGPLTVKFGNSVAEVHCVLLEDYLLLLTKSTDGYHLRLTHVHDGRQSGVYRAFEQTRLSPVVALSAAALRDDKEKCFYIIAGIDGEVQVYHLEASKELDKAKWFSLIGEEIAKAAGIWRRLPSQSSSIANIRRSLGAVEYTSDADFEEFSDDEDALNGGGQGRAGGQPNGHPPNGK